MHHSHGFGRKTSCSSVTSQLAFVKKARSRQSDPPGEGAGEGVGRTQGLTEYFVQVGDRRILDIGQSVGS
jgi:hypothetical protein